jgi:hypothetical protein
MFHILIAKVFPHIIFAITSAAITYRRLLANWK